MQELETYGYYDPGFLHLRVNTKYDIRDLNELLNNPDKKPLFSTFLHEYVHFLQDVTTTNGLQNGNFFINLIKEINWIILNDGKAEFRVPFKIDNTRNVEANLKLKQIYKGQSKGPGLIKYYRYNTEYEQIHTNDGKVIKPVKYKVYFFDLKTRVEESIFFGDICLKEFIAHSIQKQFLKTTEHPDIPYLIAGQIIEKEYPQFGSNVNYMVALCDAALMSYHPAQIFFTTIERMKVKRFIPQSPEEVYDFVYKDIQFKGEIGQKTVNDLFEFTIESTNQQYLDALKSPIFEDVYHWLHHIFKEAKKLRIENPTFICDLLDIDGNLNKRFYEIFRKLGTPFFTNDNELGGFVPPQNLTKVHQQPYQLLVFKEILSTFYGHKSCSMYDFCLNSPEQNMTNENCKTAPWKKVKEKNLCPYAQMWKSWGLENEIPIWK